MLRKMSIHPLLVIVAMVIPVHAIDSGKILPDSNTIENCYGVWTRGGTSYFACFPSLVAWDGSSIKEPEISEENGIFFADGEWSFGETAALRMKPLENGMISTGLRLPIILFSKLPRPESVSFGEAGATTGRIYGEWVVVRDYGKGIKKHHTGGTAFSLTEEMFAIGRKNFPARVFDLADGYCVVEAPPLRFIAKAANRGDELYIFFLSESDVVTSHTIAKRKDTTFGGLRTEPIFQLGRSLEQLNAIFDENAGNMKILGENLENDYEINELGKGGTSAVVRAVGMNDLAMVKALYDQGADLNISLAHHSPMNEAVYLYLKNKDGDVDAADSAEEMINWLLGKGVEFGVDDMALLLISNRGNPKVLFWLVKMGIDVSRPDFSGKTLLHTMAELGRLDTVKFLVDTELIDADARDLAGYSAAYYASMNDHEDCLEYLVRKGAQFDEKMFARANDPGDHNQSQSRTPQSGPISPRERKVVEALKQYATAQITFQIGRQGEIAGNTLVTGRGFADNFRNLYYGITKNGQNFAFISREIADAFAGPTLGAPTVGSRIKPTESAASYNGYLFLEPVGVDFSRDFALVAYPSNLGRSTESLSLFTIGSSGTVLRLPKSHLQGKDFKALTIDEMPSGKSELPWEKL